LTSFKSFRKFADSVFVQVAMPQHKAVNLVQHARQLHRFVVHEVTLRQVQQSQLNVEKERDVKGEVTRSQRLPRSFQWFNSRSLSNSFLQKQNNKTLQVFKSTFQFLLFCYVFWISF